MVDRLHHLRLYLRSAASTPLWWSLSKMHMIRAVTVLDTLGDNLEPIFDELRDEFSPEIIDKLRSTHAAIRPAAERKGA